METHVQRYEWEDALIEAHELGHIKNGALLVAIKLAKAIHWAPAGKPSGLYWANNQALRAVGAGRSTFYRHREALFELGFFEEVSGNLIPRVPDVSQLGTVESSVETTQSQPETPQSPGDNPYSEDSFTDDEYSEDYSLQVTSAADASTVTDDKLGELSLLVAPPNSECLTPLPTLLTSKVDVAGVSRWDSDKAVAV